VKLTEHQRDTITKRPCEGNRANHDLRLYQLNQAIYERSTNPAYYVIASYQTGICFDATTQFIAIVNGEESWGNVGTVTLAEKGVKMNQ